MVTEVSSSGKHSQFLLCVLLYCTYCKVLYIQHKPETSRMSLLVDKDDHHMSVCIHRILDIHTRLPVCPKKVPFIATFTSTYLQIATLWWRETFSMLIAFIIIIMQFSNTLLANPSLGAETLKTE